MQQQDNKTKNENVSIYLTDSCKEKVFGNDESLIKPYERYIIHMNDSLQTKEKENLLLIQELESKVDIHEEEIETLEKKNGYLKGLLKNFNEINKWQKELYKNNSDMNYFTRVDIDSFKFKATRHLRFLEALLLCFLGISFECFSYQQTIIHFFIISIVVSFQESTLMNLAIPKFELETLRNNFLLKEIKDAEVSQDYIYEFIDSV